MTEKYAFLTGLVSACRCLECLGSYRLHAGVSCTGGYTHWDRKRVRTVLCPELSTALSVCERRMIFRLILLWRTPSITFSCRLLQSQWRKGTGPQVLHPPIIRLSTAAGLNLYDLFSIYLGYSSYRISNPGVQATPGYIFLCIPYLCFGCQQQKWLNRLWSLTSAHR